MSFSFLDIFSGGSTKKENQTGLQIGGSRQSTSSFVYSPTTTSNYDYNPVTTSTYIINSPNATASPSVTTKKETTTEQTSQPNVSPSQTASLPVTAGASLLGTGAGSGGIGGMSWLTVAALGIVGVGVVMALRKK